MRHAQAKEPQAERSEGRACSFQPQETSGRQPDNWLSAGLPHAVVGRWYEGYTAGTAQCLTGSTERLNRWSEETRSDRTGTPSVGRDGSLRCDRESSAKQTRF